MAAVRRSTRLSSIGLQSSANTPSRRSAVWQRRQTRHADTDSEEENDKISLKSHRNQTKSDDSDENNENSNQLNKMSDKIQRKARKSKVAATTQEVIEPPKTPKSSKKLNIRPMPACKKNEYLQQLEKEQSGQDDLEHSPPKQARRSLLPKHVISPSRLLDRLSIDECPEKSDSENETATVTTQKPSPTRNKYQNARRVLNSAECQNLPGREQQLQELKEFFTEHLQKGCSGSLYVSGQPGTGKTACLSLLLKLDEFKNRLQRVYINCTSIASVGAVYKKLCTELQLKPTGRTEKDHLAAIQHHLKTSKRMVLLVLDEIDQLCSARQSVLYTIFEWPALPGARLLLVGIANSLDLTDRALMRLNAHCQLKPRLMHFPPYSKQQIVDIFRDRLEQAGVLDVFPPVTLQLLAAKVSAVSGDVRRALDIGRRVVEIAEQQKKSGQKEISMKSLEAATGDDDQKQQTEEGKQMIFLCCIIIFNIMFFRTT